MNVASLELCKELHELSGWDDTPIVRGDSWNEGLSLGFGVWSRDHLMEGIVEGDISPAYDLSYLLMRLPKLITLYQSEGSWSCHFQSSKTHQAIVNGSVIVLPYFWMTRGETPEDAACSMAIDLFEHGIITKEPSNV